MRFTKDQLKFYLLEVFLIEKEKHKNRYNVLGRGLPGSPGNLENHLKIIFTDEERALAGQAIKEMENEGLISPTYKDLVSPGDWLVITNLGEKFLKKAKEKKLNSIDVSKGFFKKSLTNEAENIAKITLKETNTKKHIQRNKIPRWIIVSIIIPLVAALIVAAATIYSNSKKSPELASKELETVTEEIKAEETSTETATSISTAPETGTINLKLIAQYPKDPDSLGYKSNYSDIVVLEEHAYILNPGRLLTPPGDIGFFNILDLKDLYEPKLIMQIPYSVLGFDSWAELFYEDDNFFYIANQNYGVSILGLNNIKEPVILSQFKTDGQVEHVFVNDKYAYLNVLTGNSSELMVIDISDKNNPKKVSNYELIEDKNNSYYGDYSLYATDNYLYAACSSYLEIMDMNALIVGTYPDLIGYCDLLGDYGMKKIWVSNGYAYIASADYGITIYNVKNPKEPFFESVYNYGSSYYNYSRDVLVEDNIAYIADADGLKIVDVSYKKDPTLLAFCQATIQVEKLYKKDNYIYLVGEGGLNIIEIDKN